MIRDIICTDIYFEIIGVSTHWEGYKWVPSDDGFCSRVFTHCKIQHEQPRIKIKFKAKIGASDFRTGDWLVDDFGNEYVCFGEKIHLSTSDVESFTIPTRLRAVCNACVESEIKD
jgi:hypothetical protein